MPIKTVISLTTDFGTRGPFAGILKGVILGINPDVRIVDLCHDIEPQNIYEASVFLAMSYKYFPPGSIHLAIVDPEVGSKRRPVLVVADNHYFIGPDNGIFTHIYKESHEILNVIHITSEHYFLPQQGATFHGRDVFAPVAAWFSRGLESNSLGDVITDYVSLPIREPKMISDGAMEGEILYIDTFGNAITNFNALHLNELLSGRKRNIKVMCKGNQFSLARTYLDGRDKGPSVLINSFGYLELFLYKGNISKQADINSSDKAVIMAG
jgi:S-adenosylmethionine hydrolase